MTATQILTEIYTSKEIKECVTKLKPTDLQQDILQHTFVKLFEKEESFILDLYNRGKIKQYITKFLYNTSTYSHSDFAKHKPKEVLCDPSTFEIEKYIKNESDFETAKEATQSVECALSKINWYKVEILRLYSTLGTHQAVADKTGIPRSSIAKTVSAAKKEVLAIYE